VVVELLGGPLKDTPRGLTLDTPLGIGPRPLT
jgi:hypothetical protein